MSGRRGVVRRGGVEWMIVSANTAPSQNRDEHVEVVPNVLLSKKMRYLLLL